MPSLFQSYDIPPPPNLLPCTIPCSRGRWKVWINFFQLKVQIHIFINIFYINGHSNWSHRYAINIFSQASYMRNWSNRGRRVRNVWWLIFYCLPAQILKVIVGFWRRQSLIPSEQIVPVWGKNGGYVKNYQLSRERLINLGRYPSKQSSTTKRTSRKATPVSKLWLTDKIYLL